MRYMLLEEQTEKVCSICKRNLLVEEFSPKGKTKLGFVQYDSWCKTCIRTKRTKHDFILTLLRSARQRAKERSFAFDIDEDFILLLNNNQCGNCAVTGIPLNWEPYLGSMKGYTPLDRASIDRIDNSLGYSQDNVQLVTFAINQFKSFHPQEDIISFCKKVAEYNK